ncbi:Glyoxylase, beta-lactamase superfamily II [Paracoccus thiocyanatus]|uniref:Glyoxylase, beta-lactamase superfamily II n=1 Tax=Paracoccus thiocyanatus TaxID=34006 RepID=A0A1N6ZLA0_9RHOB|nr:MBL fold metallo-hydrolase [Paracoccus thiocyanatus]SIR27544.1 Glyoxylase, beta-lactamase superfamily II [Paracoccus thiocyanatus]
MSGGHSIRFGRRCVLQFLGGTALAGAVAPLAASAAVSPPEMCSDGHLVLDTGFFFPDAPPDQLAAALGTTDLAQPILMPCTVPLLRHGDRTILFDAGAGPAFMDSTGHLTASLEAAGVAADEITDIIFTHCHPDHLWGVTDDFDELTFANARYHLSRREYDFWTGPDALATMPDNLQNFAIGAQSRLPRIADRTSFFEDGTEPLPGIEAFATPGHTPGHCSFLLHLGGDPLLLTGDVLSDPLTVLYPDWRWGTEHDPALAASTRRRMIDRVIAEQLRVAVYHMPPPGFGRIERTAEGAVWVQER